MTTFTHPTNFPKLEMTQKAENDNFGNYSVDGGESYVFTFMKEIYIYIANIFKILTFVTGL